LLAASSISALLSGPLLASYHLVLVLPAVVLSADQLARTGEGRRAVTLLLLALFLAWWPVPQAWPASAVWIPLSLTRFWLLLWIWVLILPGELIFARRPSQSRARLGVLVLAMAGGTAAARAPIVPDHAQPLELAAMPLVAADLIYTSDGSLWFSGIPAQGTSGLSGQGWVGYQLRIDRRQLWPVASAPDAHVWSPQVVDESMTWTHGPGADLGEYGVPCRDGSLGVVETEDGPQIGLSDAMGRVHRLTWTRAHYASPACDESRNRAWFLSDRGVGVRALRLWWVPLPEGP
jgi:hypothetical protein